MPGKAKTPRRDSGRFDELDDVKMDRLKGIISCDPPKRASAAPRGKAAFARARARGPFAWRFAFAPITKQL